ncbi:MAG: hypothetical protein ABII01_02080 [Candidatus Woesearchaeota archaeon]
MLKEILRKSIHFLLGAVIIIIGLSIKNRFEIESILLAIFIALIAFIILDYLRIELNWKIPIYHHFMRTKEKDKFNALIMGLIATLIIFKFYDYNIALAALAMAILSDAAAALMGKKFGGPKLFRNKTYVGSISALITNLIVGVIILPKILIIIPMALVATFTELSVHKLDDNLIVPLMTGLAGQIIYLMLYI